MDLTTLDPQRAYCDTCQIFLTAVYQTLIGVDPTDLTVLVPRLADSWEANAESTEFTFTLNPDATFSDGSPVTAADVKFSWERLAGLEGSASYLMSGVTSVEAPDDQTVVVTMEAPNSAFINIVSAPYMGIVSQALAEANGGDRRRRPTAPSSGSSATPPAADRSCWTPTPRATSWCSPATTPSGASRARSPASPSSR